MSKSTVETAAKLMSDMRYVLGGTYRLYAVNKQLQLTNNKHLPTTATLIYKFTSDQINRGLTSEQWNTLDAKILTLIHKGELS